MTPENAGAAIRAEAPPWWPLLGLFARTRAARRIADACGFTITQEMVPIAAFDTLTTAGVRAASALSDIGGDLSAIRFYRRAPRGWRRHVRKLKAAGRPVPLLGLRRWSQRAAKRHRQHVERRVRAAAAEALRGMIDRAICFGPEAR